MREGCIVTTADAHQQIDFPGARCLSAETVTRRRLAREPAVDTPDRGPYCRRPIRRHALRTLLEAARDLPLVATDHPADADGRGRPRLPTEGPDELGGVASYAVDRARAAATEPAASGEAPRAERDALRPAIAALLDRLAARAEPALIACLRRSREEWDQADSLSVIDADVEEDIAALRRRLAGSTEPAASAARRAIALEGLLAVDASVALVRLFERRLASLLRLRLRSATPDLLPDGRPFLDLGRPCTKWRRRGGDPRALAHRRAHRRGRADRGQRGPGDLRRRAPGRGDRRGARPHGRAGDRPRQPGARAAVHRARALGARRGAAVGRALPGAPRAAGRAARPRRGARPRSPRRHDGRRRGGARVHGKVSRGDDRAHRPRGHVRRADGDAGARGAVAQGRPFGRRRWACGRLRAHRGPARRTARHLRDQRRRHPGDARAGVDPGRRHAAPRAAPRALAGTDTPRPRPRALARRRPARASARCARCSSCGPSWRSP